MGKGQSFQPTWDNLWSRETSDVHFSLKYLNPNKGFTIRTPQVGFIARSQKGSDIFLLDAATLFYEEAVLPVYRAVQ